MTVNLMQITDKLWETTINGEKFSIHNTFGKYHVFYQNANSVGTRREVCDTLKEALLFLKKTEKQTAQYTTDKAVEWARAKIALFPWRLKEGQLEELKNILEKTPKTRWDYFGATYGYLDSIGVLGSLFGISPHIEDFVQYMEG